MADRTDPHAAHDELLVAAHAVGDATGADAARAAGWVASCPTCAAIAADVASIRAATATLPAPRRTRDFRITDDEARRLRPAGWRGVLGWFGSPGRSFAAPLGSAVATLGIAGLLLGSGAFGGAASAPVAETSLKAASEPAAPEAQTSTTADPSAMSVDAASNAAGAGAAGGAETYGAADASAPVPDALAGPSPIVVGSGLLLVLGVVLVGLRLVGRRLVGLPVRRPPPAR